MNQNAITIADKKRNLRRLLFALVFLVIGLIGLYGFAYLKYSRWGIVEANSHGIEGIAFARLDRIFSPRLYTADIRNADWQQHLVLSRFFYPAWLVDKAITDAPNPLKPPLINLEQVGNTSALDGPFVDNL